MATFTRVAEVSEIPDGTGKVVEVDGQTVAIFRCGQSYYATENTCPHRGGPLGEGMLAGTVVTCPWHGWQFDVTSGKCLLSVGKPVRTWAVKRDGDELLVAAE